MTLDPAVERVAAGATSCNVYRVGDVLVDAGTDAETLPPADAVVLTHAHADHVAALGRYRDRTDATVYLHPDERAYLDGRRDYLRDSVAAHGEDPEATIDALDDAEQLEDGDAVPGTDATVLHTPGHTPGGLSLRVADAVACGDVVDGDGRPGRTDAGGDAEALAASVDRLAALAPTALYPGHGDPVVGDIAATLRLARSLL